MENGINGLSSQGKIDPIYSKVQVVYLKSKEKEERQRELRITIEQHTGVGPLGRQVLGIQISDDEDPYFLCSLLVTEDDFKSLKTEQGLLVDFDHFPSQLIRLLDECAAGRDKIGSRFNLILNEDSIDAGLPRRHTSLQFVETNEFKHLCHLSLRILSGSDNEIKKHMAMKIKKLKEDLCNTRNVLEQKGQMLTMAYEKLEAKKQEVEECRSRVNEERSNLEQRVLLEAAEAREALSKAHLEWQRRLEKERQDLEESKSRECRALDEQVSDFKIRNQMLSEKLMHTEASVRELAKHADSTEKELKLAQREVASLRKQSSQLDMDYHEKEKIVNSLSTKLAVLDQEMKDKNLLLGKQQELLQSANQQKAQLEETIAAKDSALEEKTFTLNNITADLTKANEIIAKQYNDVQTLKSKVHLRTEIAFKQEAALTEREKEVAELTEKVQKLEARVQELDAAGTGLQSELSKCKEELENKEKAIKNNENVITWLTKQVKESQSGNLGPRSVAYPSSLMSTLGAPATSTPNVGGINPVASTLSSVHDTSAELFLQKQKETIRNLSGLRQRLGLADSNLHTSDKQRSPLMPALYEEREQAGSRKSSPLDGAGDTGGRASELGKLQSTRNKPAKPSRHLPTTTTPVVKRSDILSSYFPKS